MALGRNVTIQELRVFTLVATLQSFTKAAAALNLTQPGLSMSMRQLESKLGAPLFDRGKKAALLSPVGSALLPAAERRNAEHEEVPFIERLRLQGAASGSQGRCRLPTNW